MRVFVILLLLLFVPISQAFVVLNNYPDETALKELDLTPRFSAVPGTWLEDDVHGLDGGIEYVVHPDFCEGVLHRVIDTDSCDVLMAEIQKGLDVWGDSHPFLSFHYVDVVPDADGNWPGTHALPELEIRAAAIEDSDVVAQASSQIFIDFPATSTAGDDLNATTLAGGYVEFDSDGSTCLYVADRGNTRCGHFIRTLAHEFGHVLQLGHPDKPNVRYFDTNEDPLDAMVFDCHIPTTGLVMPKAKTGRSIMNSITGPGIDLSVDDQGGLDFLYPVCPSQTEAPWETVQGSSVPAIDIPSLGLVPVTIALGVTLLITRRLL